MLVAELEVRRKGTRMTRRIGLGEDEAEIEGSIAKQLIIDNLHDELLLETKLPITYLRVEIKEEIV